MPEQPDPKTLARRVLELDEWLNTPGSRGDGTTMEDGVVTLHELADGAAPLARAYLSAKAELDHLRSDAGPDSCADLARQHLEETDRLRAELADLRLRCDIQQDELEVLRRPEGVRVLNPSDSG